MKKITIPYFPLGLKYVTPLILGSAIYLLVIGYPIWSAVLVLIATIILTTKYVTEIDLKKKEYRDFLSFLGIPVGEERAKFNILRKIVITKDNHSQVLNTRSRSRQIDWTSFTGTLLLDENKTLDLLTKNDKTQLIKGLKEFADFLVVDVEDQTTSRHYLIDINKV
ncbi:hypothetical protein [Chryseolinea sp. H1M3-3]|uniref:hypothetical protein n=1 Tax=Chryseolinea sp. H1M3-3 TaxID=3034144 RepID=UPI0023EBB6C9|nr:hypothetical protein [Chryseolinea sp. H1M3-3]